MNKTIIIILKGDGFYDVKVPANLYNLIIVCHITTVSVLTKKRTRKFFLDRRNNIDKYNKTTSGLIIIE